MENESWLPVVGYEGLYDVSNLGNVRGLKRRIVLKPFLVQKRYLMINFSKKGYVKNYLIHRIIAKSFIPNPENKPQVNHKNGIKTDNRVENLEWCTSSENHIHSCHVLGINKYNNFNL